MYTKKYDTCLDKWHNVATDAAEFSAAVNLVFYPLRVVGIFQLKEAALN